jgi:glycosyltransferase involved in cell wall biosynthesis
MSPPGEAAVSGVPKVSETLLREFEAMPEAEVDAVTLVDGLAAEQTVTRGSVRYHYLPCKPRGKTATLYWRETRELAARVRGLCPDIVHGQPTGEYLLAATGCGRPHVVTVHGLVMRETAGLSIFKEGFLAGAVREYLQRRAVRRAANIISISPYVEDYLRGWAPGRVWPVPNPIDREFFEMTAASRNGLRILCVGIVSERKNQAMLVEACGLLARAGIDFECRVVGRIAADYEAKLRQAVRAGGVERQVGITGIVSREELVRHYAWSNAVVLASLEETSPLSLIQAMAAGRPVFGADAAGTPALLEQGRLGTLFPPDAASTLADELRRLAAEADPYWEKASLASAHARARFEPSAVARNTLEVYKSILEGV